MSDTPQPCSADCRHNVCVARRGGIRPPSLSDLDDRVAIAQRQRDAERARERGFSPSLADLPGGDFTGRCGRCKSTDLWDDASMYGCNRCGWMSPNC